MSELKRELSGIVDKLKILDEQIAKQLTADDYSKVNEQQLLFIEALESVARESDKLEEAKKKLAESNAYLTKESEKLAEVNMMLSFIESQGMLGSYRLYTRMRTGR